LSTLLVDASVWICARDPEDRFHQQSRAIVFDFDRSVAAMDLTLYEVANVIGRRKRDPVAARYMSQVIVKRCGEDLLSVDTALLESALTLAEEHGLSAYDASYLAAAHRHGWTLVSADIRDLVSKGLAVAPDAADYP
jgi:predicted nucleic acid-binding protein